MKRILTVLLAALLTTVLGGLAAGPSTAAPSGTLRPVRSLDVNRYLGAWWQQAAIPGFYSVRCARDTVARYGIIDKTTLSVDNRCISPSGQPDGIKGKATVVDTKTNAQLVVSFPGVPNTIDTRGVPNYIVAWVADGAHRGDPYRYAIVGDPFRVSGFILSRDRVISNGTLLMLRHEAEKLGFNSCLFVTSPTSPAQSGYLPLCLVR
ncbi:lipocalin family protein [Gordonia sp. X0973]|uniref:lipocalin family protein n=1 Tax=Gordonia sp. X0973 TaxID=2742602 RepID=UPI000F5202A5|nr:lipocalin family protein [Gordonia sp. X0973]QKT08047.1 lipocalin family protein [Gordonia sp. X0973]